MLVIVNTKACARRLYRQLKEANETRPQQARFLLFHLSTAMCSAHRREDISQIKLALPQGRLICVSTALIEAGVDISFGCVIRSLAGMDSIAQAAGRCNRHGEEGLADVYIIRFSAEEP